MIYPPFKKIARTKSVQKEIDATGALNGKTVPGVFGDFRKEASCTVKCP